MTQTMTLPRDKVIPMDQIDSEALKEQMEEDQKGWLVKFCDFVKKNSVLSAVVGVIILREGGIQIVIHGLKFGVNTVWKTLEGISTVFVEGGKAMSQFSHGISWIPAIGTLIVLLVEIVACIIKWYYNGYHENNKKNTSLFWKAIRNAIISNATSGSVALVGTVILAATGCLVATWQIVVGAIGLAIIGCITKWFTNWCLKKWDDYHNAYSDFARERNKLIDEGKINELRWPTGLSVLVDHFERLKLLESVVEGTLTEDEVNENYNCQCQLYRKDKNFNTGLKLEFDASKGLALQYVYQIANKARNAKEDDKIKQVQECIIDACKNRLNPSKCVVM